MTLPVSLVPGRVAAWVAALCLLTGCTVAPRSGAQTVGAGGPGPALEAAAPAGVYAHVTGTQPRPESAGIPARVYVPNSGAATLTVIDPSTFEIVGRHQVGDIPHHVTPSWDMTTLYVNNTGGNSLTVINPKTTATEATVAVPDPYNLYFTPDGTKAVVVAERLKRLDFRDPRSWELIKSVPVSRAGVDHGDFSADGRYFVASCEFSGYVVKVDTQSMEVVAESYVGGAPIDVKLSPDGSVFYVTNQVRHGVSVLDANSLAEVRFIATGRGAHGLNLSRDAKVLFVSNRLEGSVSVIDMATQQLLATWNVGGSPDMLQVSPDGSQLWFSNRFHGSVSVVDTASGVVVRTIATGAGAHGLTFFPQPGRYSVGHNGVYR